MNPNFKLDASIPKMPQLKDDGIDMPKILNSEDNNVKNLPEILEKIKNGVNYKKAEAMSKIFKSMTLMDDFNTLCNLYVQQDAFKTKNDYNILIQELTRLYEEKYPEFCEDISNYTFLKHVLAYLAYRGEGYVAKEMINTTPACYVKRINVKKTLPGLDFSDLSSIEPKVEKVKVVESTNDHPLLSVEPFLSAPSLLNFGKVADYIIPPSLLYLYAKVENGMIPIITKNRENVKGIKITTLKPLFTTIKKVMVNGKYDYIKCEEMKFLNEIFNEMDMPVYNDYLTFGIRTNLVYESITFNGNEKNMQLKHENCESYNAVVIDTINVNTSNPYVTAKCYSQKVLQLYIGSIEVSEEQGSRSEEIIVNTRLSHLDKLRPYIESRKKRENSNDVEEPKKKLAKLH